METLKVKIKKVITPEIPAVIEETEIEISFPFYSKDSDNFYKILNENAGIKLHLVNGCERIMYQRYNVIQPFPEAFTAQISNEEEFNSAYHRIFGLIHKSKEIEQKEVTA